MRSNLQSLPAAASEPSIPLVVDLDGTLVRTDTLHESFLLLLKRSPLSLLLLPVWLWHGKARLKAELARRTRLDATLLPYRTELVDLLAEEKAAGRRLVLATAADQRIAEAVAAHLGLFSEVLASDGETNLSGARKLQRVKEVLGGPFDYAGNASEDVPLWRAARGAWVVGAGRGVLRQARAASPDVRKVLPNPRLRPKVLAKALRVHQWAKNALILVPLLAAHRALEGPLVIQALVAFAAFSLCASSVYVLNDLLDLPSDRRHPTKKRRPFAAGTLSPRTGLLLVPLLLGTSVAVSLSLPPAFLGLLAAYYAVTVAYSLYLKQVMVLDVLLLAGLYTVRMLAGSMATGVPISSWLLSFSMFLFLSLALVKRSSEVRRLRAAQDTAVHGRGYLAGDYDQLRTAGTASAYLAVLVLALYISNAEVTALYRHPERLWLLCPLMLYWLTRVWMLTHRGEVDEDPLVFALEDRASYAVGAIAAAILFFATRM